MDGDTSESCHLASAGDGPSEAAAADGRDDRRLWAVLEQIVEAEGRMKAAEALGVGYRTVVRAQESGVLTRRMRAALERTLVEGTEAAVARVEEQVRALAQRVEEVAEESRGGREAAQSAAGELAALREHAGTVRALERRVARLESGERGREGKGPGAAMAGGADGRLPEPATPPAEVSRAGDVGARAGRRDGLRRGVAAGGGVAEAASGPQGREQGAGVGDRRGARPGARGGDAGGARADAAAGAGAGARDMEGVAPGVAEAGARRRAQGAGAARADEVAEEGTDAGPVVGIGGGSQLHRLPSGDQPAGLGGILNPLSGFPAFPCQRNLGWA